MMREVQVVVNPDGSVTVKYAGFVGSACFEEAQRLYRLLRASGVEVKVEAVQPTEEAYVGVSSRGAIREVERNG